MSNKKKHILGVMIAKRESTRLPGKNLKDFHGMPMFLWNLKKLLNIFESVVFDSDCESMCEIAREVGAFSSLRDVDLRGNNVPSVPLFQSILDKFPQFDYLVNVQANSPNTPESVISNCGDILNLPGINEVLTAYSNREINGSVWGFSRMRIETYGDYYVHAPDALVLDDSIDIHTIDEFKKALDE